MGSSKCSSGSPAHHPWEADLKQCVLSGSPGTKPIEVGPPLAFSHGLFSLLLPLPGWVSFFPTKASASTTVIMWVSFWEILAAWAAGVLQASTTQLQSGRRDRFATLPISVYNCPLALCGLLSQVSQWAAVLDEIHLCNDLHAAMSPAQLHAVCLLLSPAAEATQDSPGRSEIQGILSFSQCFGFRDSGMILKSLPWINFH